MTPGILAVVPSSYGVATQVGAPSGMDSGATPDDRMLQTTTWREEDRLYPREPITLAQFEYVRRDDSDDELSRGMLVREPPPGARHGVVASDLFAALQGHPEVVECGRLVFNSGFLLQDDPPTWRMPDVAWIARERLPAEVPTTSWRLAPDLAVEVVSPGNRTSDMQQRALDYLDAGTRLFWVVDPESRSVMVYRSRSDIRLLTEDDELTGEDVMPSFRLRLSALLAQAVE